MNIVMETSDSFAPRTRKSTSEALTALSPVLEQVEMASPKVCTIVRDITPAESASLVNLLNTHKSRDFTFAARSLPDGGAIVQAKYDPANQRPVRVMKPRAPKDDPNAAPKAGKGKGK